MFDYNKAIDELERIAAKVENSSTSIDEIDKCLERSKELAAQCRNYLRAAREKLDSIDS